MEVEQLEIKQKENGLWIHLESLEKSFDEKLKSANSFNDLFLLFAKSNDKDVNQVIEKIHSKLQDLNDCGEVMDILFHFFRVESSFSYHRVNSEWKRLENIIVIYLNNLISLVDPSSNQVSDSFLRILNVYESQPGKFPGVILKVLNSKVYEINLYRKLQERVG